MICTNCGMQNNEGTNFCVGCGKPLSSVTPTMQQGFNEQSNVNNNTSYEQMMTNQSINSQTFATGNDAMINNNMNMNVNTNTGNSVSAKMSVKDYFFTSLAVMMKPYTAFKEEINKFSDFKNSGILALIVAIFATLVSLVQSMYSVVKVTTYSFSKGYTTEYVWENLKYIEYFKVIGKSLLIYLGIILAIAVVYYVVSLVFKKQTNFSRLLGISAVSVVPTVVCGLVLSPLLSMIYSPLGIGVSLVGGVYTIILIYETINNEVGLEGNAKYYFNLICLSILLIAGYYLFMKVFASSLVSSSSLDDLLDLFS